MKKRIFIALVALDSLICPALAQKTAVKTNLLYDATTTMNLGVEFGLSPKWTLDVSGNYNPWTFSKNKKWKHWLVQPEARYWFCNKMMGSFIASMPWVDLTTSVAWILTSSSWALISLS